MTRFLSIMSLPPKNLKYARRLSRSLILYSTNINHLKLLKKPNCQEVERATLDDEVNYICGPGKTAVLCIV